MVDDSDQAGNGAAPSDDGSDDGSVRDSSAADSDRLADSAAQQTEQDDPIEQTKLELAKMRDQLLRTAADFDNFRKRSRREVIEAERRAREELLRELLPVFDNLERAGSHAETATDVKSLADGIAMVMRQFIDTLNKLGVERVPSVGQPFDPAQHEAIQHIESPATAPGSVVAEIQAGYRMGDRLVRPALVVVAKSPQGG